MTKAERLALGEYLSEWPENKTYQDIINSMQNDNPLEGITPCEFFDDWYMPALAERIDGLKTTFENY